MTFFAALKQLFKEKPSLEDYIAAHEPTSLEHVEFLEKQHSRFMSSKNFWGCEYSS